MVCGAVSSSARALMGGLLAASIRLWRNLGAPPPDHNHRIANDSFVLSERRGDVAAVYGRYIAGGFQLQRLVQEGLRHVVGGDLASQQVPAHVVLLGDAAGLGALLDEIVGEEARADAVGIDRIRSG